MRTQGCGTNFTVVNQNDLDRNLNSRNYILNNMPTAGSCKNVEFVKFGQGTFLPLGRPQGDFFPIKSLVGAHCVTFGEIFRSSGQPKT